MIELNNYEKQLLFFLANALLGNDIQYFGCNIDDVFKESVNQSVSSLVFNTIDLSCYKESIDSIKSRLIVDTMQNASVFNDHVLVNELMTGNDIPYVILKGCASAYYYPRPYDRTMGDVDFLVPKDQFQKAKKVLLNQGYVSRNESHACHEVFRKQHSTSLELHFEPAGIPKNKKGDAIRRLFSDVFDTAVVFQTDMGNMFIPDTFHHGLIILIHTAHHFTNEGIGLRHLCDWAAFVNRTDDFQLLFEDKLKDVGLWRFAQIITALSTKYLGLKKQSWVDNIDDNLLDALILDIFKGGNFGKKTHDRDKEAMLMSVKREKQYGALENFIHSVNSNAYLKWPVMKKCKPLLVYGWGYFGFRYLKRRVTGKRPAISIKKMKSEAMERESIYSQFNLFQ